MFLYQQIAFKNLVQRNKQVEKEQGSPAPNTAIHLPFIIVNTSKKTVIDCSISNDKWVLPQYFTPFTHTVICIYSLWSLLMTLSNDDNDTKEDA